ncbi:MAG TPA: hypothetical protein VIT18_01650 [Terrimicrobiaceae bacterium]
MLIGAVDDAGQIGDLGDGSKRNHERFRARYDIVNRLTLVRGKNDPVASIGTLQVSRASPSPYKLRARDMAKGRSSPL